MIASLLAAHTATPSVSLAQNIAENTKTNICRIFETQKKHNLISAYETQLQDGTSFCAELLRTDDKKMFELIIHRKDRNGDIITFGNFMGDDEQLYLLPNPFSSSGKNNTYIGITCNSSQRCETGETFIARIDSKKLYLQVGRYTNNSENLQFLPQELMNGLELSQTK